MVSFSAVGVPSAFCLCLAKGVVGHLNGCRCTDKIALRLAVLHVRRAKHSKAYPDPDCSLEKLLDEWVDHRHFEDHGNSGWHCKGKVNAGIARYR